MFTNQMFMNIYGDSQLVIEWIKSSRAQRSISLHGCQHAEDLNASLSTMHFHHIYREYNQDADKLSKQACARDPGSLLAKVIKVGVEDTVPQQGMDSPKQICF